jgi:hypothetical protein
VGDWLCPDRNGQNDGRTSDCHPLAMPAMPAAHLVEQSDRRLVGHGVHCGP